MDQSEFAGNPVFARRPSGLQVKPVTPLLKGTIMAKRTDAEKQAWKDQMSALAAQIKAMPEEQRVLYAFEHPVMTCEGHPLSAYNTCAIIMQAQLVGVCVTHVAGFRQWLKVGRQVTKGQHACGCILVPMGKGKPATEADPDGKKGGMKFRWVPMFDVTQTEVVGETSDLGQQANEDWDMEPGPNTAPPEIKAAIDESYAVEMKPAGLLF